MFYTEKPPRVGAAMIVAAVVLAVGIAVGGYFQSQAGVYSLERAVEIQTQMMEEAFSARSQSDGGTRA